MQKISSTAELKAAIAHLEIRKAEEERQLKEKFDQTLERIKPSNIIKNAFAEISESPEVKETLLNKAIGLATGFVSKKLLVGKTSNPIKKLFGLALEVGVTNVVARHPEGIKAAGSQLFKSLFRKKHSETEK